MLHAPESRQKQCIYCLPLKKTKLRLRIYGAIFLCAAVPSALFAEFGAKLSAASTPQAVSSLSGRMSLEEPASPKELPMQTDATEKAAADARAELDEGIRSKLVYPEKARRRRQEGTVVLRYVIHDNGTLKECTVVQSATAGTPALLVTDAQNLFRSLFPLTHAPLSELSGEITIIYKL